MVSRKVGRLLGEGKSGRVRVCVCMGGRGYNSARDQIV